MVWLCILGGVKKSSWLLPVWNLPDVPCLYRLWIQELGPGNWDLLCQSWGCKDSGPRRALQRLLQSQECWKDWSWASLHSTTILGLWTLKTQAPQQPHRQTGSIFWWKPLCWSANSVPFGDESVQTLRSAACFPVNHTCNLSVLGSIYTDRIFICAAAIYCCMCYALLGWETVLEQYFSPSAIGKHICCSLLFVTNITHVISTYV